MADGKQASWSDAEEAQLQKLMALKKAAGKAKTVPILPAQAGGAMSDGSKRRLEAMTEEDEFALVDGHGPYGHGNWLTREFEESQNVEDKVRDLLPEGVASFHEWGQTVFEFGKLRGTNTSYAEAMNDKKLESYLTWCLLTLQPTSLPMTW